MVKMTAIGKSFDGLKVFDNFSIGFLEDKITVILGPSGCGKTTLLNILAGLVKPDRGTVGSLDTVSYLFQEPRLLPWLTVWDNVALVLRDKLPDAEIQSRVEYYLRATGVSDYARFYPAGLSGGLRQRAAIARAFVYEMPLLLMDEPFKSLDIKTRYQLIEVLLELWRQKPRTIITVTHDPQEAVMLGDQIVILSQKPVRILKEVIIELERDERAGDEGMLRLEKEILEMVLG